MWLNASVQSQPSYCLTNQSSTVVMNDRQTILACNMICAEYIHTVHLCTVLPPYITCAVVWFQMLGQLTGNVTKTSRVYVSSNNLFSK